MQRYRYSFYVSLLQSIYDIAFLELLTQEYERLIIEMERMSKLGPMNFSQCRGLQTIGDLRVEISRQVDLLKVAPEKRLDLLCADFEEGGMFSERQINKMASPIMTDQLKEKIKMFTEK